MFKIIHRNAGSRVIDTREISANDVLGAHHLLGEVVALMAEGETVELIGANGTRIVTLTCTGSINVA